MVQSCSKSLKYQRKEGALEVRNLRFSVFSATEELEFSASVIVSCSQHRQSLEWIENMAKLALKRTDSSADLASTLASLESAMTDAYSNLPALIDVVAGRSFLLHNSKNRAFQMEWIGWYNECMMGFYGSSIFTPPASKYGSNTYFDAVFTDEDGIQFPVDFKAHSLINPHGKINTAIPLNDKNAMQDAVERDKALIYAVTNVEPVYETSTWREVRAWDAFFKKCYHPKHSSRSRRSAPRPKREPASSRSRRRKVAAVIKSIDIYAITTHNIGALSGFAQGKQANGSKRNKKLLLDLNNPNTTPTFTIPITNMESLPIIGNLKLPSVEDFMGSPA